MKIPYLKFLAYSIISGIITITACSKDEDKSPAAPSTPPSNDFAFLKVGSEWNYSAAVPGFPFPISDALKCSIIKDLGNNNYEVITSIINMDLSGGGSSSNRINDTIVWELVGKQLFQKMSIEDPNPVLLFKSDAQLNESWGPDSAKITVVGLNETVTVKAGEFKNCFKLQSAAFMGMEAPGFLYMSIESGLIKIITSMVIPPSTTPQNVELTLSSKK